MNKVTRVAAQEKNPSARRSQRRINKLLDKNISQYEIPNPYRNSRANCYLPRNLTKQLSRMESFSVRALQNLRFNQPAARDEVNELLSKMRVAVQRQSQELTFYISSMAKKVKKLSERTTDEEEIRDIQEKQENGAEESVFMPKSCRVSIELNIQNQEYQNLPMVSHQSEGASMMYDNYETDKLIFYTGEHLLQHMEQPMEFYEG